MKSIAIGILGILMMPTATVAEPYASEDVPNNVIIHDNMRAAQYCTEPVEIVGVVDRKNNTYDIHFTYINSHTGGAAFSHSSVYMVRYTNDNWSLFCERERARGRFARYQIQQ